MNSTSTEYYNKHNHSVNYGKALQEGKVPFSKIKDIEIKEFLLINKSDFSAEYHHYGVNYDKEFFFEKKCLSELKEIKNVVNHINHVFSCYCLERDRLCKLLNRENRKQVSLDNAIDTMVELRNKYFIAINSSNTVEINGQQLSVTPKASKKFEKTLRQMDIDIDTLAESVGCQISDIPQ
jgi:hypothetical protein